MSQPSQRLSPEGRQIVEDVRNVVVDGKNLVLVKNEGNLIQDFLWDAEHLDRPQVQQPEGIVGRDTAKQHGQQTAEGLKTLGTLIVTNGQFRKLRKQYPNP